MVSKVYVETLNTSVVMAKTLFVPFYIHIVYSVSHMYLTNAIISVLLIFFHFFLFLLNITILSYTMIMF